MFVDFQPKGRPVVGCLFGAGLVPEAYSFSQSEIAGKTQLPRSDGRLSSLVVDAEVGRKEGVHNVHTLGFGLGRTGGGLGRIADVFGGVADLQVLEPGSSPTSGTVFPQVRGFLVLFSCGQCPHSRL